MEGKTYIIVAGDAGVYAGWAEGGVEALSADGRIVLYESRHLMRYRVAGGVGEGSVLDLARLGIDPNSPSIAGPLLGASVFLGVRRALTVSPDVIHTFRKLP
jgi:hypothetical protein